MKTKHLYVCLISLAVALVALGVNGYRTTAETLLAKNQATAGPVRNLRFTLFEQGIRPAAMRINAGLVNISIEDKTADGSGLVIERVDPGQRSAAGNVRNLQDQKRGRSQLNFTPGTYELRDAVRPDNKAVLVVEP